MPFDPDLLVTVAEKYYLLGQKEKKIGQSLTPAHKQSYVARALEEARQRYVVVHNIDPESALIGERQNSDDITLAFVLRDSLVVDVPEHFTDDQLHTVLANETSIGSGINTGDHIALAGGRTIVRLATAISRHPPAVSKVVLTPLGGWLWSGRIWAAGQHGPTHLERPLNPDYSALILANGLHSGPNRIGAQREIRFSQISHPLYAKDANEAQQIMRSSCAFLPGGAWNWELTPPTKAYVGVGVIQPGSRHRMMECLRLSPNGTADPVYHELEDVMQLVEDQELRFFGDIANRLFCALPLPGDLKGIPADKLEAWSKAYEKAAGMLEAINSRSVVMEWAHLHSITRSGGTVKVIAGGAMKLCPLWTVLLAGLIYPNLQLVNSLSTDSKTSETLVKAQQEFTRSSDGVKKWYANMIRTVFRYNTGVAHANGARSGM